MSQYDKFIVRHIETKDFEEVRQIWLSCQFTIYKYSNEAMINIDRQGIVVAEHHNGLFPISLFLIYHNFGVHLVALIPHE